MVLAFWCGEEQGIYGSFHYTDEDPLWPLEDTVLYIGLDNLADPPGPYLVGSEGLPIQESFLAPSAKDPIRTREESFVCGSDECPFRYQDIPFLRYMSRGTTAHTLEDTFKNADLEGTEKVANEALRGLLAVAWE